MFLEANMEKQTVRKILVTFLFGIVAIFSLGAGILGISYFIQDNESISLFSRMGISCLVAFAFIVGYFINAFVMPLPLLTTKSSCWSATIFFAWGLLVLADIVSVLLNFDHPIEFLLLAIFNCSMAGWMLAQASTRLRSIVKI